MPSPAIAVRAAQTTPRARGKQDDSSERERGAGLKRGPLEEQRDERQGDSIAVFSTRSGQAIGEDTTRPLDPAGDRLDEARGEGSQQRRLERGAARGKRVYGTRYSIHSERACYNTGTIHSIHTTRER